MKTTVNFETFANGLKESFSIEAIEVLFDYFEQYEDSCDCELEYDPVAIRCEFSESTINEIITDYGYMMDESRLEDDDAYEYVMEFLNDKTMVCGITEKHTFVFQQF
jgi:hypothetical protein